MKEITSRKNSEYWELLKLKQRKHRQAQRLFLGEGPKLLEDAVAAGWLPEKVIICPEMYSDRGHVGVWVDCPVLQVSRELMVELADTESPQGVIGVFAFPERQLNQLILRYPALYLVLDQVRDPGNAGTLLRTAAAVGADGVIALKGTVELTNSKVLRSSMGGIFRVPWLEGVSPAELVHWAKAKDVSLLSLEPRGGKYFHQANYNRSLAVVVGSEAQGLDPELAGACQEAITVPMPGGSESLNAAMAATLVLFQVLIGRGL